MIDIIKNILNSGKLFERIKEILDEVITTKEEKGQLQIRLQELVQQRLWTQQCFVGIAGEKLKSKNIKNMGVGRKHGLIRELMIPRHFNYFIG